MDLGGKIHARSAGWKKYPKIIRDDYSRYVWLYFISHNSDRADRFAKFLSDFKLETTPHEVVVIRHDDGGEINEGKYGKLCRDKAIKEELTADSPAYCGVTKQGLVMI